MYQTILKLKWCLVLIDQTSVFIPMKSRKSSIKCSIGIFETSWTVYHILTFVLHVFLAPLFTPKSKEIRSHKVSDMDEREFVNLIPRLSLCFRNLSCKLFLPWSCLVSMRKGSFEFRGYVIISSDEFGALVNMVNMFCFVPQNANMLASWPQEEHKLLKINLNSEKLSWALNFAFFASLVLGFTGQSFAFLGQRFFLDWRYTFLQTFS